MFLKKFELTKGEMNILAIATALLIIGIAAIIVLMQPTLRQESTDIKILGYRFATTETTMLAASPVDDEPFEVEITEANHNDVHSLENMMSKTYGIWQRFLRNVLIFIYLVVLFVFMMKKNSTQFQILAKGILLGAGSVLLLFTLQLGLDVYSGLVSFGHDFIHLVELF